MADQDKRFLDKLTPKQRQFLTLGGIALLLFGVLWAVFRAASPKSARIHRLAFVDAAPQLRPADQAAPGTILSRVSRRGEATEQLSRR